MAKRTREDMLAEDAARAKTFAYLDGFRCGVGFTVIPDRHMQNDDFAAGWHAGRKAYGEAKHFAQTTYGYTLMTVMPLPTPPA